MGCLPQASATESRGTAQIFTSGDFNLSTTSATWTPDAAANGGFDVCTSNLTLFNTTAAQQVLLNQSDVYIYELSAPLTACVSPHYFHLAQHSWC